jgi:DNA adenine methylase
VNQPNYRVKPALSWPGGKSKLLGHILPLIPEHTCYVDPFAGGLAVFLAKPRSNIEVLNDLNGDLVTFYRCVRFHSDVLITELEFVLNSRKEFFDFADQPGLTDIQRASRWFFRNRTCFRGGNLKTFGVSPTSTGSAAGSRGARMEAIRQLNLRLDRVIVENLDWQKCVDLYDRPTTTFFLDPPYTDCDAGMYSAWTVADVMAMRERLSRLRGSWIVTLNDNPEIRRVFAGCQIKAITRPKGIGGQGRPYKELVITPR